MISEAARIYGVSTACLRFWEKEGLISFERDESSNYRKISYSMAERIGNLVMFRNLGISVKDLSHMPFVGLEDFDALLVKSERTLIDKFNDILDSIEQIHAERDMLDKIRYLKSAPFRVVKHAMEAIEPYYYYSQESTQSFLTEPNRFAAIINAENPTHMQYGFFNTGLRESPDALRPADGRERLYLNGLLRISSENMLDHTSGEFIEKAKELGYSPSGDIVGQFLIALFDGKPYDFYEAWMELDE